MRKFITSWGHWVLLGTVVALCVAGLKLSMDPSSSNRAIHLQTSPPRKVPALAFTDRDGKPMSLQDFKGKLVVLDIWATWCGPCREEFPRLDRLQANLADQGLAVVALSVDRGGRQPVDRFYEDVKIKTLAEYLDPSGDSMTLLGLRGLPTTLILDHDGNEIARVEGEAPWDGPEVQGFLQKLLSEGKAA